jgi:uncharacterized membrane protein
MWFRKRTYSWGYQPTSWQGWLVFASALFGIIIASWLIEDVVVFVIVLVAIVSILGLVSWHYSDRR